MDLNKINSEINEHNKKLAELCEMKHNLARLENAKLELIEALKKNYDLDAIQFHLQIYKEGKETEILNFGYIKTEEEKTNEC